MKSTHVILNTKENLNRNDFRALQFFFISPHTTYAHLNCTHNIRKVQESFFFSQSLLANSIYMGLNYLKENIDKKKKKREVESSSYQLWLEICSIHLKCTNE